MKTLTKKRIATTIDIAILIGMFLPVLLLDWYLFGTYEKIQSYDRELVLMLKHIFSGYFLLVFALYLLKDSFNGQSIGKKMMKLKVVHERTGLSQPLQNFVRNFAGLMSWGDIILAFVTIRRIGDIFSGTRLVEV